MGASREKKTLSLSLKGRFLLATGGLLLAVLGFFNYQNYVFDRNCITEGCTRKLSAMTELVKSGLTTLMASGKNDQFKDFITAGMTENLKAMRLINPDSGKIISSTMASEDNYVMKNLPIDREILRDGQGLPRSMFVPVYNNKPCQGCHGTQKEILAVLNVEMVNQEAAERLHALKSKALISFGAGFLLIFAPFSLLYMRFIDRPLKLIQKSAKAAAGGDFGVIFCEGQRERAPGTDYRGPDELGRLCADLNRVFRNFGRIKEDFERRSAETVAKMEKMATLGELAAAVAHEIKNPLAGISGAIQVFAEDIPDSDPRKEIVNDVLGEIDRLDQSVRNLLAYARPPILRPVNMDILSVVERARRLLEKQADSQGVQFLMPSTAAPLAVIEADPEQMQQVFFNIFQNCLHSMPSGGVLSIDILPDAGTEVEVRISDTGMGIPADSLEHIFKPFFTTKHSGSGLGLAIGKSIVEAHGGRISVDSRPGLGSTFHVIMQGRASKDG
ncbi:MAG: ATP-binding protein [Nitrospiraceae bacterium]|nr:ATP-binding protein [Nitrospiraceae bacterium]